ncbi:hypothetical protein [Burkholderia glumae]
MNDIAQLAEARRLLAHASEFAMMQLDDAWHERAAALLALPAPAIPVADRAAIIEQCALRAAIHSQYPIENDFDRGYQQARLDAARSIRTLKDVPAIGELS